MVGQALSPAKNRTSCTVPGFLLAENKRDACVQPYIMSGLGQAAPPAILKVRGLQPVLHVAGVGARHQLAGRCGDVAARHPRYPAGLPSRPPRSAGAPVGGRSLRARNQHRPRDSLSDRKSTRLNSSHLVISYAVFCLKKTQKLTLTEVRHVHVSAHRFSRPIAAPAGDLENVAFLFFFNDPATTEIYPLSLHDALPLLQREVRAKSRGCSQAERSPPSINAPIRSEEHTSELQSPCNLVCRLLLEKK